MHINKIYFILLYITVHRYVSVASATIISLSYKKTNDTQTTVQNVSLKPSYFMVTVLIPPRGRKMSNYRPKYIKLGVFMLLLIATCYGLDGPRIESRWGLDFPHLCRPALGPSQLPLQ